MRFRPLEHVERLVFPNLAETGVIHETTLSTRGHTCHSAAR